MVRKLKVKEYQVSTKYNPAFIEMVIKLATSPPSACIFEKSQNQPHLVASANQSMGFLNLSRQDLPFVIKPKAVGLLYQ